MAKEHVHGVFQSVAKQYDAANNRISLGMHHAWKRKLVAAALSVCGEGGVRDASDGKGEGDVRGASGNGEGDACGAGGDNGRGVNYGRDAKGGVRGAAKSSVRAAKSGKILDVCCGTGDITARIASEHPDVHVTGLDFSSEMLKVAHARTDKMPNVELVEGNAMRLPFKDNSFDAAVISFGLRNTPDYLQVIKEMARVVCSGGLVACLDASVPSNCVVLPFYKFYYKTIMPTLGGGFSKRSEYKWLYQSTQEFLTKAELAALFEQAGLRDVNLRSFMCGAAALHTGYVK